MSQEQPRKPTEQGGHIGQDQGPVKYGDVFNVSGDLASKTIAPEDANMMQSAETMVFGHTQKGGAAATMQAAATRNERAGLVGHRDATDAASERGVTVTESDVPGARIVTERVAGQVVGQYVEATPVVGMTAGTVQNAITIGEALEATAQTAGNKPVDQSDAAAIQAAEVRATGSNVIIPGGLAATAQSAACHNAAARREEDKIKLTEVLTAATTKLPADKVVTRADAEGVVSAEIRNNPNLSTHPGGVAASMAAAARLNENTNV
ncbi:late embryogenesis abundant protein D-34 isoform X2 [Ricinus communis]|uniref:Late embryogenesis abundant protein D-34, putative n=1 Tax=Ricinus communis TaxID=3988 RepID=B9RTR0_RICCO|nr:late embryogenesis abundant protein D-34 isoform X2 [Ricinus communis]EEF45292.1 Late embryogenesis abundant protein D-34, putative [Ricinus communis]|eukprot:XP_002517129.1 late embryogenesis abundant protein D-34 [Ricinus communis]